MTTKAFTGGNKIYCVLAGLFLVLFIYVLAILFQSSAKVSAHELVVPANVPVTTQPPPPPGGGGGVGSSSIEQMEKKTPHREIRCGVSCFPRGLKSGITDARRGRIRPSGA